jgi:hypothetical protein
MNKKYIRIIISAGGLVFVAILLFVALQFLLAPKQPVSTYEVPYAQSFDDVNLKRWFLESGVWTIREGTLLQTVGGEDAAQLFVPLKVPEDQPYHASVYITLKKDSKNVGMTFNAQYPDMVGKQHRVYISRINPTTLELVSGYVDESGTFVTQVQVPLTLNTTEFRLDVYVYSKSYLVQVNGQRLIENRPLIYNNGMIGFYSLGPVIFDSYKLTAAQSENPGDMVYNSDFDQDPGGAGWVPISGAWQIESKQMMQSDPTVSDAAIGYEASTFENYTIQSTFNHLSGQGGGLLFNMPSPYQIRGAQVVRYSDETDSLIWGFYDDQGAFNRQGFVNVPPASTDEHEMKIFSGDNSYDIYLDNQVLARDVPLQSIQGSVGLISSHSSTGFTSVEVFPLFGGGAAGMETNAPDSKSTPTPESSAAVVAPIPTALPASTQVLSTPIPIDTKNISSGASSPFQGVFDGSVSDAGWTIVKGNWTFSNGNFVESKVDGFDFSAIYNKTAFQNFSMQVGLTHNQGSGAGLLFNMPYNDRLTGASMVRYSDNRDNAIMWGYFDETGVYKSQGYAEVAHAGTDRHTIRIVSGKTSFSIYVDDRLLVQSVPYGSTHNFGYIGLLTSRASASFDEVTVDGVGALFKGTYTQLDGFSDQRVISGKWELSNNKAIQTVSDPADYIWNTGVQASQYTITANIALPDSVSSGAGFIFHMSERGTKKNAYIIRLKDGGKSIWWGSTDTAGKFVGQGSSEIADPKRNVALKIIVNLDKMTVFINDKQIVADVPLPSQDGWVGLLAYGGPVTFTDVKLEVEK